MTATSTALGLDIGSDQLRALQLTSDGDGAANISGFATVSRPEGREATADAVVKLIEALAPDDETPVRLIDSAGTSNETLEACTTALAAFDAETSELDATSAVLRARGTDEPETGFIDCDVPAGLLAAHPGLDLENLAPAAGVALHELGLGFADTSDDAAEPVAVWTPDTSPEAEEDTSPNADERADEPEVEVEVDEPEVDVDEVEEATSDQTDDVFGAAPAVVAGASAVGAAAAAKTFFTDDDDTFFDDTDADETTDGVGIAATTSAAAASPTAPPQPPTSRPTAQPAREKTAKEKKSGVPVWLWGLAALIGLALVLWLLLRGGSETETADTTDPEPAADVAPVPTEAPEPTPEPEPTVEPAPTPEPAPEPTDVPTPEPTPEPEPTVEPTPDPLEGLPPLEDLPTREAVFRPPNLYLLGPATEDDAARSYARALEVLPAENIIDEFIIRPDAPEATDGNVRIEQAVLFATGSAQIAPPFIPILEIGVQLMSVNPDMSMVIEGHTDDVGSDEVNLDLSQRRANAVVQYLVGRGIDPGRLSAVGFGEADPVAPNDTEATRQVNRRIEVQMIDLLLPRDGES